LQIVVIERDGSQRVAYQPPQQLPAIDVTPSPEAEPVPSDLE
jgi:hypothetical protein